jgi:predicted NAD/FAD-binding protein
MEPKLAQTDVAVVGGGMAGLTAAFSDAHVEAVELGGARAQGMRPGVPETRARTSGTSRICWTRRSPAGVTRWSGGSTCRA